MRKRNQALRDSGEEQRLRLDLAKQKKEQDLLLVIIDNYEKEIKRRQ
jgi:hypothetical protein